MVEGVDYVIARVRELASGNFEATATLLTGPGHRIKVWVPRTNLNDIAGTVARHMTGLRMPPTGPR